MSTDARGWRAGSTRRLPSVPLASMADASGDQLRRVRVLVLASDPATANRVRCQLEDHSSLEVIGVVHSADAAVVACARRRIDVVVTVSAAQATRTRLLQRRFRSGPVTRPPELLWRFTANSACGTRC